MISTLIPGAFDARSTGSTIDYRVLVPDVPGPLPFILHLHGAMSSAVSLEHARDAYDRAWASGVLPPAIVACPSTPTVGGFYIDYPGGPGWETLVASEFPEHLAQRFALGDDRVVFGASMGGYGALKLAFRQPARWRAVAALCPVIFPAETAAAVPERNRPSILGDLNAAMGADTPSYAGNSVHGLARLNRQHLLASGQKIFFDCGDRDEFNLHDGASYLHRLLDDIGIAHEFRSVAGAGHADAQAAARQDEAFAFIGRALA
jgi:S-formylglutathione hydrolase